MSNELSKMETMIDKIFLAHMEMESAFKFIYEGMKESESFEISGFTGQKLSKNDIKYMTTAGTKDPFVLKPKDTKILNIIKSYDAFSEDQKAKIPILTINDVDVVYASDFDKIKKALEDALKAFFDLYPNER